MQAAPGFVKYIVYTLSGIGAQWFSQMLFVISLLLLLVRKVVLAVQKEERKSNSEREFSICMAGCDVFPAVGASSS